MRERNTEKKVRKKVRLIKERKDVRKKDPRFEMKHVAVIEKRKHGEGTTGKQR